ncbi:hypothetical protein AAF712_004640 [Marasmius tenuissimus]|uniref:Uncharacterized protein n=1 Tax=Marasmius tenuissimus TaxID=585030 RepID=A0ABR3A425_9AGAR
MKKNNGFKRPSISIADLGNDFEALDLTKGFVFSNGHATFDLAAQKPKIRALPGTPLKSPSRATKLRAETSTDSTPSTFNSHTQDATTPQRRAAPRLDLISENTNSDGGPNTARSPLASSTASPPHRVKPRHSEPLPTIAGTPKLASSIRRAPRQSEPGRTTGNQEKGQSSATKAPLNPSTPTPPRLARPRHSEPPPTIPGTPKPSSSAKRGPRQSEPGRTKPEPIEEEHIDYRGEYNHQAPPKGRLKGIPESLNGHPLIAHQQPGVGFMVNQENPGKNRFGGILGDDTGLGKTVQSCALIQYDHDNHAEEIVGHPTLVVLPNVGLALQWSSELARFIPQMTVFLHHGPKKAEDSEVLQEYDIVLTTYTTLRNEWNLREVQAATDEAHTIRNPSTKGAKACYALDAEFRWCLSATALQNSVYDLMSLFTFLRRQQHGDPGWFKRNIGEPIDKTKKDPDAYSHKDVRDAFKLLYFGLDETFLRRRKDGMTNGKRNLDIPDYIVHAYDCELSPLERQIYIALEQKYSELVQKYKVTLAYILVLMLRLRQVCLHPKLLLRNYEEKGSEEEDEEDEKFDYQDQFGDEICGICHSRLPTNATNAKAHKQACKATVGLLEPYLISDSPISSSRVDMILRILRKIGDMGEKTIVFSTFTSMLDILECFMEGFKYVRYDGKMKTPEREKALKAIQKDPSVTIILMSLKAAGVGLNLAECNHVILADIWWNPAVEEQAIGRAHRMGQTRQVHIHRLIAKDTIETRILELQERKRKLAKAALDNSDLDDAGQLKASLNQNEALALLTGANVKAGTRK